MTGWLQVIQDKYGIQSGQIRAYIHYHPSYYHLHVHFMHLSVDAGAGMAAGKAHLLDDVIGKILCYAALPVYVVNLTRSSKHLLWFRLYAAVSLPNGLDYSAFQLCMPYPYTLAICAAISSCNGSTYSKPM